MLYSLCADQKIWLSRLDCDQKFAGIWWHHLTSWSQQKLLQDPCRESCEDDQLFPTDDLTARSTWLLNFCTGSFAEQAVSRLSRWVYPSLRSKACMQGLHGFSPSFFLVGDENTGQEDRLVQDAQRSISLREGWQDDGMLISYTCKNNRILQARNDNSKRYKRRLISFSNIFAAMHCDCYGWGIWDERYKVRTWVT